jgi:hypothetical protein
MEVRTGLVKDAISSCFMRESCSSLLCSISLEQKLETDEGVKVLFPNQEPAELHTHIESVIKSLFLSRSGSTQIRVCFYIFRDGGNLFSTLVNAFSIASVLSGLEITDTLCSSTLYAGDGEARFPVHMAYRMHSNKVAQFLFTHPLEAEAASSVVEKLVESCKEQGEAIKREVAMSMNKDSPNG